MRRLKLVFNILNSKEKKFLILIVIFLILATLLEIIGVTSIIPVTIVILKNDINEIQSFFNIGKLPRFLNSNNISFFVLIFFVSYFVLKNLILSFFAYFNTKYYFGASKRLSQSLFEGYMNLPYLNFIQKNSSHLVYNCIQAVDMFRSCLQTYILFFSEIAIFLGLSALLYLVDWVSFLLITTILICFSLIIYQFNQKRQTTWGAREQLYEKKRLKTLMQSFNSIKELKIKNVENFFFKEYHKNNTARQDFQRRHHFNLQTPRFLFETIIVIVLVVFIFQLKISNYGYEEIIVKLGIFSAATLRLYPTIIRLVHAALTFNHGVPVLENIIKELSEIKSHSNPKSSIYIKDKKFKFESFKMKNICFTYSNNTGNVINKCNLLIKPNEMIGIYGQSGSGKTTLVDIITGLIPPREGSFEINHKASDKIPIEWKKNLSYVSQNVALFDDSIQKNITFGEDITKINRAKLDLAIEISQLKELILSTKEGINSIIGERGVKISGGEKQRIGIARGLYLNSNILIFDEATSALDKETETKIIFELKKIIDYKTIVIISHELKTLELCDRIFQVKNGSVIESNL